jgi:hypothetical protein
MPQAKSFGFCDFSLTAKVSLLKVSEALWERTLQPQILSPTCRFELLLDRRPAAGCRRRAER